MIFQSGLTYSHKDEMDPIQTIKKCAPTLVFAFRSIKEIFISYDHTLILTIIYPLALHFAVMREMEKNHS